MKALVEKPSVSVAAASGLSHRPLRANWNKLGRRTKRKLPLVAASMCSNSHFHVYILRMHRSHKPKEFVKSWQLLKSVTGIVTNGDIALQKSPVIMNAAGLRYFQEAYMCVKQASLSQKVICSDSNQSWKILGKYRENKKNSWNETHKTNPWN